MFGRAGRAMDRNVIICLSVVAVILLLTGLAVAVTAPLASAQPRVSRAHAAGPGTGSAYSRRYAGNPRRPP